MGVLDCVARSAEEYVRIAVRLGSDADWREHVSNRIRESRWRIFEDSEAVLEHERLFRELVLESRHR
jgi:predicted O-linked N-acetylglucosamine transferase (SPINDLY family)